VEPEIEILLSDLKSKESPNFLNEISDVEDLIEELELVVFKA
jgi:hypothetical protein